VQDGSDERRRRQPHWLWPRVMPPAGWAFVFVSHPDTQPTDAPLPAATPSVMP
jgi:hypothetical protein